MKLLRKMAEGSAVEVFLALEEARHVLVQISRAGLSETMMGKLLDWTSDLISHPTHPELLSPRKIEAMRSGQWLISTDGVTGWTAADFLARGAKVSEALLLDWAITVCEALEVLHVRGQTHGCLAPRHLHLHGDVEMPMVRVLDTALLHLRGEADADVRVVEPEYLAPERAAGLRGTRSSDVWGVGALLAELLIGRPLCRGNTDEESRALARRALAPRLPEALSRWQAVLDGCLEPLPVNRFSSALELRQALLSLA